MALPAIPAIGALLKGTGAFAILRGAAPRFTNALRSVPQNARAWLGFGAGTGTGYGLSSIMNRLGIEDERTERLAILGVALIAIVGIGQLLDINIDL